MASATSKKVEKLYVGLGEKERVRMLAKLSREHNTVEMDKLRNATPSEHADAYNRALRLLRVLNGNVLNWISIAFIGMERDRYRLGVALADGARQWFQRHRIEQAWRLTPYPVTESEYRAISSAHRDIPESVDEWMEVPWEKDPKTPGLHPVLAEILQARPSYDGEDDESDDKAEALDNELWDRFYTCFINAIERGELHEVERPENTTSKSEGPWVTAGELSDWALGTTEETFEPISLIYAVPAIGTLFNGHMYAKWDIRPDSEADDVKARRDELRDVFMELSEIHPDAYNRFPNFEPPLTLAQRHDALELVEEINEKWLLDPKPALTAVSAAKGYAAFRAQLEGLIEGIKIVQRDDFFGEDPLWYEARELIEKAQEEAQRFVEDWDNSMMNYDIRREMGLLVDTLEEIRESAPLPLKEPDTEAMLSLIRAWGEP